MADLGTGATGARLSFGRVIRKFLILIMQRLYQRFSNLFMLRTPARSPQTPQRGALPLHPAGGTAPRPPMRGKGPHLRWRPLPFHQFLDPPLQERGVKWSRDAERTYVQVSAELDVVVVAVGECRAVSGDDPEQRREARLSDERARQCHVALSHYCLRRPVSYTHLTLPTILRV